MQAPDVWFDWLRTRPQLYNFATLYTLYFALIVFSTAREEKATGIIQRKDQWNRRVSRWFIPYSLVGYQWRFPHYEAD